MAVKISSIGERLKLAKGGILRHTGVNKYGKAPAVQVASTPQTLWAGVGLIPYPTVAAVPVVVSDHVDDTPGFPGARRLRLDGLDANFRPITETIDLDGTTPVPLSQPWIRVNRTRVVAAGANQTNLGVVTVTIGADVVVHIAVQTSSTQKASFTVGAEQIGYILGYSGSVRRPAMIQDAQATFDLYATHLLQAEPVSFVGAEVALALNGASSFQRRFEIPLRLTGPADVELRVVNVTDNDTDCTGFLSYVVEDLELPN